MFNEHGYGLVYSGFKSERQHILNYTVPSSPICGPCGKLSLIKRQVMFVFSVYKVFENVAEKYDVMNDAMSLGVHRLWKDMLLHVMHPQPGARLLDVAGGTGKSVCMHPFRSSS